MPISHKYKAIFVHIPKTGGTSIERFMEIPQEPAAFYDIHNIRVIFCAKNFALQHVPAIFLKQVRPDIFKSYYKFTFVRNPYDRVLSEYSWQLKMKADLSIDPNSLEYFSNWMKDFYNKIDRDHKCTQKYLIYDGNKLLVDAVFKYENYDAAVAKLVKKFKITDAEIKNYNVSIFKLDKQSLLTQENKDFIYNLYKEDFDTFGYEK